MGHFLYEKDLLKHHIRTQAWLPLCKARLQTIRAGGRKRPRRLRYFTFCAVGAIDVLMLDVAKVIRQSDDGNFDTVVFFDLTPEDVDETRKRIPGAVGFAGDFVQIMNAPDPQAADLESLDHLEDSAGNREELRRRITKHEFLEKFPFDVVNLDLEEFVFKPKEPMPGEVVNALRKLFEAQKREFVPRGSRGRIDLDGFSLMFTTQIGPNNLTEDYSAYLEERIKLNIDENPALGQLLQKRTGYSTAADLKLNAFEEFFRIGLPKVIASILLEEDWHVDPDFGIKFFEIERAVKEGAYKMMHLVMNVKRNNPRRVHRNPGNHSLDGSSAYKVVAESIFSSLPVLVTEALIDSETLQEDLNLIRARRRKFYPEGEVD